MKFKKIVGFGDSWMYGDELLDPDLRSHRADAHFSWRQNDSYRNNKCFLGLLGQHYQVPVENFGMSGGSHQSAVWSFLWWLRNEKRYPLEQCLILVGHTDDDRTSFYNSQRDGILHPESWYHFVHSTWIETKDSVVPPHWKHMIKHHMAYSSSDSLSMFNRDQSILLFDGTAHRKGIPLLQFNIMPGQDPLDVPSMLWPRENLVRYFLDHPENQDRKFYCANGHPNEMGHEIIRDRLIPEIDRVILAQ